MKWSDIERDEQWMEDERNSIKRLDRSSERLAYISITLAFLAVLLAGVSFFV